MGKIYYVAINEYTSDQYPICAFGAYETRKDAEKALSYAVFNKYQASNGTDLSIDDDGTIRFWTKSYNGTDYRTEEKFYVKELDEYHAVEAMLLIYGIDDPWNYRLYRKSETEYDVEPIE